MIRRFALTAAMSGLVVILVLGLAGDASAKATGGKKAVARKAAVKAGAPARGAKEPRIARIAKQVRDIERQAGAYRRLEMENVGEAGEGGATTAYLRGDDLRKLVEWTGGENGYFVKEWYFADGKLVFVLETVNCYKTHIFLDENGNEDPHWKPTVGMVRKNRYYFDNQRVIRTTSQRFVRSKTYMGFYDRTMTQQDLLDEGKYLIEEVEKADTKRPKRRP